MREPGEAVAGQRQRYEQLPLAARQGGEGDDTLSVILSKAFMLADDDKIKDASINSQIRGGSPRP